VLKEFIPASRKLIGGESFRVTMPIEVYGLVIVYQCLSEDEIAMRTTKIPPR
jgi:hypothetical protein